MSSNISTNTTIKVLTKVCKPKICEVGGGGIILPLFGDTEQGWSKFPLRAILYLCGLLWFFMGVAIVSDIFMGAIERITAKKNRMKCSTTGKTITVKVWNDTIANLTLMALGSSAPEILLSIIELCTNNFLSGDLGPSTIVGSAAFNLFVISAVCVYAIPDGEIRMIKDTGVFAITASCSVFAYVWLYFIVLISTPDEVDILEGAMTFLFFPILVIMAFGADKGYFTFAASNVAKADAPVKCERQHDMEFLTHASRESDGWGCDGRFAAGGCRSGITGYHQTRGIDRYRCAKCDYDLCKKCVEFRNMAAGHHPHVIGSDVSREELASVQLRMLQQHGEGLSDEQLARLIQKEHAEPLSRAAYRVKAVRAMVGGMRVGPSDEAVHSLSSIVPVDGGSGYNGSNPAKKPIICPSGHSLHNFTTPKANFNCDFCHKRFPIGTPMVGCRTCNFDACNDCKSKAVKADITIEFCSARYAVLESIGTLVTYVQRVGDLSKKASVEYKCRDGTAKRNDDYEHVEGVLEFEVGEMHKPISIAIVDDVAFEQDEEFYIDLSNPSSNNPNCKVALAENKTATISIVDDDQPGQLGFEKEDMQVTEGVDNKVITVTVRRREGSSGTICCEYRTQDESAVAGKDYLSVCGTLVFEPGQMSRDVPITILGAGSHYDRTEEFRLIISDASGHPAPGTFDPDTDGGAESCIFTIVIESDEAARGRIDRVMKVLAMDWDKAQIGHANWTEQFKAAVSVNGGEEGDASVFDYVMHIFTVFWKVLFAAIPPVDFCDGWLCFVSSLAMIGVVTAFIGDMAGLLGCTLNIPDKITAITFVALGTSLPDTFASKTAAEQDPYADASIGNVTGSNSVNVFLGLGLPWVMGSIYWKVQGKTALWKEEYSYEYPQFLEGGSGMFVVIGGDLGFSVCVFSACAIVTIFCLCLRRKLFGGELGGPAGPKKITAIFLVGLWFTYIGLSSWMILKNQKKAC